MGLSETDLCFSQDVESKCRKQLGFMFCKELNKDLSSVNDQTA